MTPLEQASHRSYDRAAKTAQFANSIETRVAFNHGWNASLDYRYAVAKRDLAGEVSRSVAFGCIILASVALLFTWALWRSNALMASRGIVVVVIAIAMLVFAGWQLRAARRRRIAAVEQFNQEWADQA